jgi:hypothetical protein
VKSSNRAQSATSLPRAPRDEASARSRRYLVMMGIRVLCFVLMVVITPYGWYTWVLGAAAVLLPYFAVVTANVGEDVRSPDPESPERALPAAPPARVEPPPSAPRIIRLGETSENPPADDRG